MNWPSSAAIRFWNMLKTVGTVYDVFSKITWLPLKWVMLSRFFWSNAWKLIVLNNRTMEWFLLPFSFSFSVFRYNRADQRVQSFGIGYELGYRGLCCAIVCVYYAFSSPFLPNVERWWHNSWACYSISTIFVEYNSSKRLRKN